MPNVARLALVPLLVLAPLARAKAQERATPAQLAAAREYVRRGWRTLTRSERDLLSAAIDPKFQSTLSAEQRAPPRSLRWPVYVARGESLAAAFPDADGARSLPSDSRPRLASPRAPSRLTTTTGPRPAERWERLAALRRERVNRLMWDERDGLYYDYNFEKRAVRRYPFVTNFYPLWAGLA